MPPEGQAIPEVNSAPAGTMEGGGQPLCYGTIAGPGCFTGGYFMAGGEMGGMPGGGLPGDFPDFSTESSDKSNTNTGMLLAFNVAGGVGSAESISNPAVQAAQLGGIWTPSRSDATDDPAAAAVAANKSAEQHPASITEAEGANSDEKRANANITIDANGNVNVDSDKLAAANYQAKLWIDEAYKGSADDIRAKLETAKAQLAAKGIDLQIPATLPAFITNRSGNPTPDVKPDPKPDGGENGEDGDNSCPDGNCGPKPGPQPKPEPDEDPNTDTDTKPGPNTDVTPKPDGLSKAPEWIDKAMGDRLSGKVGNTPINPHTLANWPRAVMPNGLQGIFARHHLSNPPTAEELAELQKDLDAYYASDEGKNDLAQLDQNAKSLSDSLANGPMGDKAGAKEMMDFAQKLHNPGANMDIIGNTALAMQKSNDGTLTVDDMSGSRRLLPEALQKAIVHLAIADVAAQQVTTTNGTQETLLDLKRSPSLSDSADYQAAVRGRISEVIKTLTLPQVDEHGNRIDPRTTAHTFTR